MDETKAAVRKPAAFSMGASVGTLSAREGETLSRSPCSAGRSPVKIEAWEGRVSGTCTVACSNSAPPAAIPSRRGAATTRLPEQPTRSARRGPRGASSRCPAAGPAAARERGEERDHQGEAAHERGILPGNEVDMGRMWVAGEWSDAADGRVFEVVNPATEEPLDTAPRAAAADVDRAVAAAARAFPD